MDWPPNYIAELKRRADLELAVAGSPELLRGALEKYAASVTDFASDCCWLAEPRNVNRDEPTIIPLALFDRQKEFLLWLNDCFEKRISAPVEKSRDSGATWMACVFATWLWLFKPGSTIGFGSRKEMLVDRQGDMQSIFTKIRSLIRKLPHYLLPRGFDERQHSNFMRILNPQIDTAIIGEGGDNICRGGRTSIRIAGLDVADGGADANALAIRHGPRVIFLQQRRDLRADEAGTWAHVIGVEHKVEELRFEALSVGAGAAASLRIGNRPCEGEKRGPIAEIVAWSSSDRVPRQPWDGADGRSNQDMFLNANSQAWWHLRTRFYETYKASIGVEHDREMVISLDPDLTDLRQLKSELAQVLYKLNANGKIVVDKQPDGYKSPNLADAVKIAFAPASLGVEIIAVF